MHEDYEARLHRARERYEMEVAAIEARRRWDVFSGNTATTTFYDSWPSLDEQVPLFRPAPRTWHAAGRPERSGPVRSLAARSAPPVARQRRVQHRA